MADSTSKLPSGEEKENSSCMESSDQMEPESLNTDNHSSDVLQNNHCTAGTNDMKTELPSSGGDGHLEDSSEPECGAELGSVPLALLKKDDSGIDVERSPVKEPGGSDESESGRTDSDTGPGLKADSGTGPSGRPSTSNESEGLVADIDSDEADAAADETANVAALRMSDTDSGSEPIAMTTARKRRRGAQRDGSPSPSDERAGPGEESVPGWSSSSDDDEGQGEEEMEVDPAFPKDTWHPLAEVHRREIGYSNSTHMPFLYRRRCAGSVHLVRRLQLQHKMTYHEGCVNALHFNKSGSMYPGQGGYMNIFPGTLLASGSDDLNIVLWDWVNNKPFLVFDSGHRSNVFQSKFVPYSGDTHVVSCARDGQIRLAELSSTGVCKATKKLAQHRGAAHKLALLQDSAHELYSCGEDAVTFHLDLRQDRPNKLCTTKEGDRKVALYSIHAHPFRTEEYCVGGRDHFVRIYDKRMINETVNNGVMKKFCPLHLVNSDVKANVTCAVYSYNGEELLGTYNDEDIYLFRGDHSDGAGSVHRYTGHRNNATVKGVNFYGPRSEFIVSGSDCSNVFIWEKESEKIVQYFHADDGGVVNVLEPHPHAPILATSGLDHDVKVWSPTAQEASKLPGLARVTRRNTKERDEERENEPDMIDGQMLWLLMQHLRRSARRRARNEGEDLSSSSSEHSDRHDDEEDNDDGDGDAEMGESMQCVPS